MILKIRWIESPEPLAARAGKLYRLGEMIDSGSLVVSDL
jgi:hypothetical protein